MLFFELRTKRYSCATLTELHEITNRHFVVQKWGFSNILGGGEIIFSSFYGSEGT